MSFRIFAFAPTLPYPVIRIGKKEAHFLVRNIHILYIGEWHLVKQKLLSFRDVEPQHSLGWNPGSEGMDRGQNNTGGPAHRMTLTERPAAAWGLN
jgi:hypothetical protein